MQSGSTIKTSLPYIRNDIPIVVVFRALNVIPDKDILDHICYDRNDTELFEMLKPCLEDAFPIQNTDVSILPPFGERLTRGLCIPCSHFYSGRARLHRPSRYRRRPYS